jgi:hypothetical protein
VDKEQLGSVIEMMRDEMIDAHAEMTVSTEHLRAVLDALEAALARAEGAGWKLIETAPKDGMTILACYERCYDKNGFAPIAVKWRTYHPNAQGEAEWREMHGHKVQGLTHWMPLPAAPEPRP